MKIVLLFISAIVVVLGAAGCATQHGAARSDPQASAVQQFHGGKF
ncbi:MAG: hypothetical protein ABIP85_19830 [Chthoniobacteraceae bacterium]